jgi:hypothetical protein
MLQKLGSYVLDLGHTPNAKGLNFATLLFRT